MHYMELGGAERALLGLLDALDPQRVSVDLFLHQHTGDFLPLIPDWVNLLPERHGYRAIERPMSQALRMGELRIVLARLKARRRAARYHQSLPPELRATDSSVFQTVIDCVEPHLPALTDLGTYDLAISFLQPHNIVLHKVNARRKVAWIHTDYSTVHFCAPDELPIWQGYDHIVSISPDCTTAFLKTFPTLKDRIILVENILPATLVRTQAAQGQAPEMDGKPGIQLVSVGRVCHAKNYDSLPQVARQLVDAGLDFTWTIVGPGDATAIRHDAIRLGVDDRLQFIGAKTNPYPYIARADIYLQPSRYEGKSVTVREAQMLHRPVIITDYPTAHSQIVDHHDGIICPLSVDGIAQSILTLAHDKQLRQQLQSHLLNHDYSNSTEVNKIYSLLN